MRYRKGQSGNPKGKPKGAANKFTRSVREALKEAFDELQLDPRKNLVSWGRKNPDDFYKLCGKLIPAQLQHEGNISVSVITGVPDALSPAADD